MLKLTTIAGALVLGAMMPAAAQDAPPLVQDLQPGYDLNDHTVLDMLGVQLGMQFGDAEAALTAKFPEGRLTPSERPIKVSDGRGNDIAIAYHSGAEMAANDGKGTATNVRLAYSTAISGSRVSSVYRYDRYDDAAEPSVPDLMAALEAKYGPPSYVRRADGMMFLYHVWFGGQHVTLTEEDVKASKKALAMDAPNCFEIKNWGPYTFMNERHDRFEGCTAAIVVELQYGRRDDLASSMTMSLTDYRRWYDDGLATDRWLVDQVNQLASSGEGASAPAL